MPLRRVRESILNRERVATGSYIQPAIVAFQGRKISRIQVEWLDPVATRSRFCIERSFGKEGPSIPVWQQLHRYNNQKIA
jgi:hypothetical protein